MTLPVHIRWMIRRDFEEVLEIEQLGFEFPWQEADLVRCLRQMSVIGLTAEHAGQVVGFTVYEARPLYLDILNLGVHPSCWRRGIGRQIIDALKKKLCSPKRAQRKRVRIRANVRESNLDAQLFFKAQGFTVEEVLREYSDNGEDAYRFVYRSPGVSPAANQSTVVRIAE